MKESRRNGERKQYRGDDEETFDEEEDKQKMELIKNMPEGLKFVMLTKLHPLAIWGKVEDKETENCKFEQISDKDFKFVVKMSIEKPQSANEFLFDDEEIMAELGEDLKDL